MDPLGVSQIISTPAREIITHARVRSEDVRSPAAPPTPAKDVPSPLQSTSASRSSFQTQQQSPVVPSWPASPLASSSSTNDHPATHYSISSPWSPSAPTTSPQRPQQQQQRVNSPGQPRSPFTRDPITRRDSDDEPISAQAAAAAHNARMRQQQQDYATQQANLEAARARPQPQQQNQNHRDHAANVEAARERDRKEGYIRVRVLGLERNKKDLWIKLEATTNLSTFHQQHIKPFTRSYGEFIALHLALASNHPQLIIPALPLTETAAANPEEEERLLRIAFQKWVDRLMKEFNLVRDEEVRSFLESHFGYTPTTIRRRLKASSSFSSLSLRGSKTSVLDADDEMSRTKSDMAVLENQFADVARAVDKVGRNRKLLAGALFDLSEQLTAFSTLESHKPLAVGFRRLADGTRRLGEMDSGLATAESVTLADALAYSSAEAKEAKDALLQRQLIVEEHRNASKTAINKKRQIEKLKSSNNIKPERADEALDEFEDAKKHESVLAGKLTAVSERLAPSLAQHVKVMHQDLFEAFLLHARTGVAFQKQAMKDLEGVRGEIKSIPAKTAGEIVYVHQPSPSLAATSKLPTHSRTGSAVTSPPLDPTSPLPSYNSGTQSMIVPPTHQHQHAVSPSTSSNRINSLAQSVYLPGGATDTIKGRERVVDERRRVDARSAAAKLAGGF